MADKDSGARRTEVRLAHKAADRAKGHRQSHPRLPEAKVNAGRGRAGRVTAAPVLNTAEDDFDFDDLFEAQPWAAHVDAGAISDASSSSRSSSGVALEDLIVGPIKRRKGPAADFEVLSTNQVIVLGDEPRVPEPVEEEDWEKIDLVPSRSYARVAKSPSKTVKFR